MAQIIEDVIVIKFSKLIKGNDTAETSIVASDIQQALEEVAQQLVGDNVVVEVERA